MKERRMVLVSETEGCLGIPQNPIQWEPAPCTSSNKVKAPLYVRLLQTRLSDNVFVVQLDSITEAKIPAAMLIYAYTGGATGKSRLQKCGILQEIYMTGYVRITLMSAKAVRLRKEKFNGELWGTYDVYMLHSNPFVTVLWQPRGTIIHHVSRTWSMKYQHLQYFFPNKWYAISAKYGYDNRLHQCYCDIILPWKAPQNNNEGIIFVDLELDIIVRENGKIERVDEDEFETAIITMRYPEEIIQGARKAFAELTVQAQLWTEPFSFIPQEITRQDFHLLDTRSQEWRSAIAHLQIPSAQKS